MSGALTWWRVRYHKAHLYIIDVSQSVEHDHPYAFDFLRADITHVDDYFSKKGGIKTLGLRSTFEWIIKPPAKAEDSLASAVVGEGGGETSEGRLMNAEYDQGQRQVNTLQSLASGPFAKIEQIARGVGESDEELTIRVRTLLAQREREQVTERGNELRAEDQAVFRQAYIPQTLNEVYDPERDIRTRNEGNAGNLIYANVIGVEERAQQPPSSSSKAGGVGEDGSGASGGDSGSETSSSEDDDGAEGVGSDGGHHQKTPRGHRHEDRDVKKVSRWCNVRGRTW